MKQGLNQTNVFTINPQPGETVPLSVTATSSTVQFLNTPSAKNYDVVIQNSGTKVAYVAFGYSGGTGGVAAVTATVPASSGTPPVGNGKSNNFPILPGLLYVLQKNSDANPLIDTIAGICGGSDTTTLLITSVQGS